MTSLAHLLGMIYDLKTEVEKSQVLQQYVPLRITKKSWHLSEHDVVDEVIEKSFKLIEVPSSSSSDGFYKVSLDVSTFNFDDVTVKVRDHKIIVSGRHDEREDEFGFVSRQFTRRYILPDDYEPNTVTSLLTDDDTKLTIKAEKKPNKRRQKVDIGGDRFIPIHHNFALTEDELS